jgi:hypothetical protein
VLNAGHVFSNAVSPTVKVVESVVNPFDPSQELFVNSGDLGKLGWRGELRLWGNIGERSGGGQPTAGSHVKSK